jgi:hypothetical protein
MPRRMTSHDTSTRPGKSSQPRRLEDLEKSELIQAIKMVPDLDLVPFVASVAHSIGLNYPLKNQDDLKQLFQDRSQIVFEGHRISWKHVCKYFREEFFPVQDEQHLLSLVRIALAMRQQEFFAIPKEWKQVQNVGGKKNG